MEYRNLGSSDIKVSSICLGTMTWGQQNSEDEGHEQMDYAVAEGINFFDTAEMYAIPPRAETQGRTEEIIGTWFQKTGKRKDIILATKVAGPGMPWIRGDNMKLDRKNILAAVEGSLKRLQTDYIDLYQLHWPNRTNIHFGRHWPEMVNFHEEDTKKEVENFIEVLETLDECIKAGKIREVGLSDESAWGTMKYLALSEQRGLPRMVTLQNEYNLLHRKDEPFLSEICVRENVGYLPWSPLACGRTSGKYLGGAIPAGSRKELTGESHRDTPHTDNAIRAYIQVAKEFDLDVNAMAIAYIKSLQFVTSTIIGATSMEQLKTNISAKDIVIAPALKDAIENTYKNHPSPF